ncbi:MAG: hypothetical protein U5O39_02235 [Gammaproteobacteria bacterium]|nr:hypothetical protein [Gammaproteobacteria bacterium]
MNLWGAYDATAEEWAGKVIASVDATSTQSVDPARGWRPTSRTDSVYSVGDGVANLGARGQGLRGGSAGGYLKFAATPKASLTFGGQYFADDHDARQ